MIYRLAAGIAVKETSEGGFLVASRPLRMVRLNRALLDLARGMEQTWRSPSTAAEANVLEKLANAGFVQRQRPHLAGDQSLPSVSIVIPVKDRADELRHCLLSLKRLDYPTEKLEIVVVDDGSSDNTPAVAREFSTVLVESGAVGGGPALARNRGAKVAGGEILAFIDSDCIATRRWLTELLPVFAESRVAAVGGLVDGMYDDTALDRYEAVMSSLNLGRREMSGGAGGDTFYLPSCNLLVRKQAFMAAGGFQTALQVGEDVDLTWRLRDAGWTIVYLPDGAVQHAHRSRPWPFMKRRFDYGTSEGLLQRLHPVRGKKMHVPPILGMLLLLLAGSLISLSLLPLPLAAALMLTDTTLAVSRMRKQGLRYSWYKVLAARVRAAGSLGYYLGYHLLRYYMLPYALAVLLNPPIGILMLLTILGVGLVDYRVRKPKMHLLAFYLYYLLEQLAYGTGVFWGCLKMKSFSCYRLDLHDVKATA